MIRSRYEPEGGNITQKDPVGLELRPTRPGGQRGEHKVCSQSYDCIDYVALFKRRARAFWADVVRFAAGKGPPPSRPFQVEVHARQQGRPACPNNCIDCCGRFLRTKRGLPGRILLQLYRDLVDMGVTSVVLSGTHTDPACLDGRLLSRLITMGGPAWGIKLHTFGLNLSRRIQHAIIEAAQADPHRDSYVSFSRLTTDPKALRGLCRPRRMSGLQVLRAQEKTLRSFFTLAAARGFPLSISLNCRLTRLNSGLDTLVDLLRWFADHTPPAVQIRMTTDYLPSLAPHGYREHFFSEIYLPGDEARRRLARAIDKAALPGPQRQRIHLRIVPCVPRQDARECLNGLLLAAVSAEGLVFPCQSIAGAGFRHLAYGDLRRDRFGHIWSAFIRALRTGRVKPTWTNCPHCAAECERQVCLALAAEAGDLKHELDGPTAPIDVPAMPAWPLMRGQWVGRIDMRYRQ